MAGCSGLECAVVAGCSGLDNAVYLLYQNRVSPHYGNMIYSVKFQYNNFMVRLSPLTAQMQYQLVFQTMLFVRGTIYTTTINCLHLRDYYKHNKALTFLPPLQTAQWGPPCLLEAPAW